MIWFEMYVVLVVHEVVLYVVVGDDEVADWSGLGGSRVRRWVDRLR